MNSFAPKSGQGRNHGFTLVEMLVAVSILALIMVLAAQMIGATSKIWKNTTSKIEAFQNARDGFQLMTDELRQATVSTYWDYYDNTGKSARFSTLSPFIPSAYGRQSDLHFKCGPTMIGTQEQNSHGVFFQAPLGYVASPGTYGNLQNLLNAVGFFIQVSDGTNVINVAPPFITTAPVWRYRLMQFIQPSEQNLVFNYSIPNGATVGASAWFTSPLALSTGRPVRIVANNIIGLIIWPKSSDSATDTLSTNYAYDSRLGLANTAAATASNAKPAPWSPAPGSAGSKQPLQMNQMPPILRVTMIAIDEQSAKIVPVTDATDGPLCDAVNNAFQNQTNPNTGGGSLFVNPQNMDSDLLVLQYGPQGLASVVPHINFRVFSTTVVVKSARFSTQ